MEYTKITEVTEKFGVSSRTLRYYEQVGLLRSERPPFEKYRFYDQENINRIQQILVLRKMQIPIKDIFRIYENQSTEILVQSFVNRMEAIDNEIDTLSQLKSYLNDFMKAMTEHGITQISALPLLYEKVEKELLANPKQDLTMEKLNNLSNKLAKPLDMDIVELPSMFVITSILTGSGKSEIENFCDWLSSNQIPFGRPGSRTFFEYQSGEEIILMQKLSETFVNREGRISLLDKSPFEGREFLGGLFAVSSAYTDEDLGALQQRMIQSFDDNPGYEIDFLHSGNLRHETLIESVFSAESNRERINLYIPVRQRKPNFTDYPEFEIIDQISIEEIENANPILQEYAVDFHKITPIYYPHFQILENKEAEFKAWISQRKLDTNIAVRLPFRVDIEFLAEEKSEEYLWGTTEGSLWFSHGNCTYTMNAENYADIALKQHALVFQQPMLENEYSYPQIGDMPHDCYNKMTWIIGEKHFAIVLNGEVCFCGVNFPYMNMNLHLQEPQSIIIGTNGQGKKLFRSIKVSQLKTTPKTNTIKGTMQVNVKQSNNTLPNLRQIVHGEYGQNYWFNGCAAYVMECLGELDYDYWFFAGLTGENFIQIFSKDHFRGDGVMDYRMSEPANHFVVEEIFNKIGYASTFVPLAQILENKELYIQTLISYIDKGIPVIINDYGNNPHNHYGFGVLVGYENYGKTLLYMCGDVQVPVQISTVDLLTDDYQNETGHCHGWLFIGEKKENRDLAEIYRERILSLPQLFDYENKYYCFGVKAFHTWADQIEDGFFEDIKSSEFKNWDMYTVYVCCLATNTGGSKSFLDKTLELNPNMTFINEVIALYAQTGHYWNDDNGTDLEAIGGGFNVTLEALQDETKRKKIVKKLRGFADCMSQVSDLIEDYKFVLVKTILLEGEYEL